VKDQSKNKRFKPFISRNLPNQAQFYRCLPLNRSQNKSLLSIITIIAPNMGITLKRPDLKKVLYLYLFVFKEYFNIGIVIANSLVQLPGANN
jgi:hypothetical protein